MSLITDMIGMLDGMDARRIEIAPERCISVRNRNASCQRCVEACAAGVLHYNDGVPEADASKCIGCGTCATACPTACITLSSPSMQEVARAACHSAAALGGRAVFCCQFAADALCRDLGLAESFGAQAGPAPAAAPRVEPAPAAAPQARAILAKAGVCVLPCLGHVDESLLVELAARGAKGAWLVSHGCEACPHASAGELCETVCSGARSLLAAFGCGFQIQMGEEWPSFAVEAVQAATPQAAAAALSGTEPLFPELGEAYASASENENVASSASGLGPAHAAAPAPAPAPSPYKKVDSRGVLSHHIPLKRTRLYNCLKRLGDPGSGEVETRLAGSVSIDADSCMSCTMCAVFCPTGALVREDDGERFGLRHRPSLCMQCRCCEQICPKSAVTVSPKVSLDEFLAREELFLELDRPEWVPNKPDSMYDKFQTVIGKDKNIGHF